LPYVRLCSLTPHKSGWKAALFAAHRNLDNLVAISGFLGELGLCGKDVFDMLRTRKYGLRGGGGHLNPSLSIGSESGPLFAEELRAVMRVLFVLVFSLCALLPLHAAEEPSSITAPSMLPVSGDLATDVAESAPPRSDEAEGVSFAADRSPVWAVSAGFISLGRAEVGTPSSFVVYNRQLQQVYNTDTADRGGAAGPDITLDRSLGTCWDIEARYFQADGWNINHVVNDPDRLVAIGYGGVGIANTFSMTNTSRLYNIEVNLRNRHFERCPLIVGFRALQLHETFETTAFDPQPHRGPRTQTNNFLWGLQIGAEPILWRYGDRFQLEGLVKTGVYGGQSYQQTFFPSVGSELSDGRGSVPFVAELGLSGIWTFNQHWSLRAGCEIFWMTNMALATDQSLTVKIGSPPTGGIYNKATTVYGGVTVNLECRF
jgi:hypothetical protein